MNRSVFFIFAVVVFLSACSKNDEPVFSVGEDKTIRFSAQAPKNSRVASTTTATLQDFIVYAFTNSELLMDGVKVSREGGLWKYSPSVYWPSTPVNFYAVSPDLRTDGVTTSTDNIIKGMASGSIDLLYAVSMNQFERATPIILSFRHAMSRVVVNLSCANEGYLVRVNSVLLKNITQNGDFALPNMTTSATNTDAVGVWSNLGDKTDDIIYNSDIASSALILTPTAVDVTEGNLDRSFYVPQELIPFKFSNSGMFSGSFVEIDCEIYNKTTGDKIWPTEHTPKYLRVEGTSSGRMLFPLSTKNVTAWEQGYSYTYNIVINSTYSIDTIEFNPSVVNYMDVTPY